MQHATGRIERPGESQEALDGKINVWRLAQSPLDRTEATNIWAAVDLGDHVVQGSDKPVRIFGQAGISLKEKCHNTSCDLVPPLQDSQAGVSLAR